MTRYHLHIPDTLNDLYRICLQYKWAEGISMIESEQGEWVRYKDMKELMRLFTETLLCDQGHHLKSNEYLNGEKE